MASQRTTPTGPASQQHSQLDARVEKLIRKLTIHLAGACGQRYTQPLDLFYAVTQPYHNAINDCSNTPPARLITSAQAQHGFAKVQDQDMEKTFEIVIAREFISVAAEAFLEQASYGGDGPGLIKDFELFLSGLGTQPVTVPVSNIVDGMREALVSCQETTDLEFFRWPRYTYDFDTILENFILTHECFFHDHGRMPSMEVTFYPSVARADQDLPITIHFARNLPLINFIDLQNEISEGKFVQFFPTLDQVAACDTTGRRALHVEYETSLPGHIGWNNDRLEGVWPASLAGDFGAERQEGFIMPLGVAAIVRNVFPGNVTLERVVRAAVPVLVKRTPDICGGRFGELQSPTAHECFHGSPLQAVQGYSFFDPSLPSTPIRACHARIEQAVFATPTDQTSARRSVRRRARRRATFESPISMKELQSVLQTKAALGMPEKPLDLNPLTMAGIWDATAPLPGSRDAKCYTVRDRTAEHARWDRSQQRATERVIQAGRAPLMPTQPKVHSTGQRRDSACFVPDSETIVPEPVVPEPSISAANQPSRNVQSSMGPHECCSNDFLDSFCSTVGPDRLRNQDLDVSHVPHRSPQRDSIRASAKRRRRNALSNDMRGSEDACQDVYALRKFRLQNWRREPEKLTETEVDILQEKIQDNYREAVERAVEYGRTDIVDEEMPGEPPRRSQIRREAREHHEESLAKRAAELMGGVRVASVERPHQSQERIVSARRTAALQPVGSPGTRRPLLLDEVQQRTQRVELHSSILEAIERMAATRKKLQPSETATESGVRRDSGVDMPRGVVAQLRHDEAKVEAEKASLLNAVREMIIKMNVERRQYQGMDTDVTAGEMSESLCWTHCQE